MLKKKLKCIDIKKPLNFRGLLVIDSLVLIPRIELGTSPLPRVRSTN